MYFIRKYYWFLLLPTHAHTFVLSYSQTKHRSELKWTFSREGCSIAFHFIFIWNLMNTQKKTTENKYEWTDRCQMNGCLYVYLGLLYTYILCVCFSFLAMESGWMEKKRHPSFWVRNDVDDGKRDKKKERKISWKLKIQYIKFNVFFVI